MNTTERAYCPMNPERGVGCALPYGHAGQHESVIGYRWGDPDAIVSTDANALLVEALNRMGYQTEVRGTPSIQNPTILLGRLAITLSDLRDLSLEPFAASIEREGEEGTGLNVSTDPHSGHSVGAAVWPVALGYTYRLILAIQKAESGYPMNVPGAGSLASQLGGVNTSRSSGGVIYSATTIDGWTVETF